MRHRHRVPRLGRSRLAHAPHDADLRSERPGEAGVHPQLRPAGPAAGFDRAGADRTARRHFHRAERQPRLLRLRHRHERHRADRRSAEAAERTEGTDRGQPGLSADRRASIFRRTWARTRRFRCSACSSPSSRTRSSAPGIRRRPASITTTTPTARPATQARRDFIAAVGESTANECLESRQMVRFARHHHRAEAVRRLVVDGPGVERQLLRTRRALRHAFVKREPHADLLQPRAVPRALQRRRPRHRRARSDAAEGNRLLHSGHHDKTDQRCVGTGGSAISAARPRSRPTTSRSTTAASSTSSIAPTPACTSSS